MHFRKQRAAARDIFLVLLDTSGSLVARRGLNKAKGLLAGICRDA